jgi:hypothetical protein
VFLGLEDVAGVPREAEVVRQQLLLRGEIPPPPPRASRAAPGLGHATMGVGGAMGVGGFSHFYEAPGGFAMPPGAYPPGFMAPGAFHSWSALRAAPLTRQEAGPVTFESDPGGESARAARAAPAAAAAFGLSGAPHLEAALEAHARPEAALPAPTQVLVVRSEDAAAVAVSLIAAQQKGLDSDQRRCPGCRAACSIFLPDCHVCEFAFGSHVQ